MTYKDFILVGKISSTFGLKGWVKIISYTDPRKNILSYSPIYISCNSKWVKVKLSGGQTQGKGVVMWLGGVIDIEQAVPLVGTELAIRSKQLKPTRNGKFYWSNLIGLAVINVQNQALGKVDHLLGTRAHDVLVVKNKDKNEEQLIPFVMNEIIKVVDLDNHIILVDWGENY